MSHALMLVITALGWFGALAGLLAYVMVSKGRWAPDSLHFQAANLVATSSLFLVAAVNGVWPSVAANIAWMVIGTQTLFVIARARKNARRNAAQADLVDVEMPLVAQPLDLTDAERAAERLTEQGAGPDGPSVSDVEHHRLVAAVR